jgi:hypothetical protein
MTYIKIFLVVIINAFYSQIAGQDFKSGRIDLAKNSLDFRNLETQETNETNIFWLGEFHGTKLNFEVSFNILKHLVETVGISHIILESTFFNEIQLNKYLKTGNEKYLDIIYSNSKKTFSYNKESREYYKNLYELNKVLEPEKRFDFVSLDIEHNYIASHNYIKESVKRDIGKNSALIIIQIDTIKLNTRRDYALFYRDLKNDIRINEREYIKLLDSYLDTLDYMATNIWFNFVSSYSQDYNNVRDSLIWVNFSKRDSVLNFSTKKSFGKWGMNHIYQSRTKDNVGWLAYRINENNKKIKQNSTVMLYSDCEFMMPSFYIPQGLKFLFGARKKDFINVRVFNSTRRPIKIKGTKKLVENSLSDITFWEVKALPEKINLVHKKARDKETIDYFQNVILIRNSKATTPYDN